MTIKLSCFSTPEEVALFYTLLFQAPAKLQVCSRKKARDVLPSLSIQFIWQSITNGPSHLGAALQFYREVILRRTVSRVPVSVSFTMDFVAHMLEPSDEVAPLALGMVRTLNQIVDLSQTSRQTLSFVDSLKRLGFDGAMADFISEVRHSVVHKSFPPTADVLKISCYLFMLAKEEFWDQTFAENSLYICPERLEGLCQKVSAALPTHVSDGIFVDLPGRILETLKKGKTRRLGKTNERSEQRMFAIHLRRLFAISDPNEEEILSVIRQSKISNKKMHGITLLLSFVAEKGPLCGRGALEVARKIITEEVNIAEFRSFFQRPEFRNSLRELLVRSLLHPELGSLWKLIQDNFGMILSRSAFFAEWIRKPQEAQSSFDSRVFSELDGRYNTEGIVEKMFE